MASRCTHLFVCTVLASFAFMILEVFRFGAAIGERIILDDVSLQVATPGIIAVMGPGGSGKSTLLRAIAATQTAAEQQTWGVIKYQGLRGDSLPYYLPQKYTARSQSLREAWTDVRSQEDCRTLEEVIVHLGASFLPDELDISMKALSHAKHAQGEMILAYASAEPLLLIDEVTARYSENERDALLFVLAAVGRERAVIYITHNRLDTLAIACEVILLAGGYIQERGEPSRFFTAPTTDVGQNFVSTGSCSVPFPTRRRRASSAPGAMGAPLSGFHWVIDRKLAGLRRPGLLGAVDEELRALRAVGIETLICLEEVVPIPSAALVGAGIALVHFPIVDMRAPDIEKTHVLCMNVLEMLALGKTIGIHCKGGLGRTGTILASILIGGGLDAHIALEQIRAKQPLFVQSDVQVDFLSAFEKRCRNAN